MRRLSLRHPLATRLAAGLLTLLCLASPRPLRAGFADPAGPGFDPSSVNIPDAAKAVTVVEHTGSTLPLDAVFYDETGARVTLGSYFQNHKKPVLLQIGYFRCPMLCSIVSKGLVDSLQDVKLNAGPDYDVVFLSIDPKETPALAAEKKQSFLKAYARDGSADGWHLLTGTKDQIDRVTEAAGVEYKWVGQAQQYSHPAVVVIATPEGKISRYLYGVKYDPKTMRLSLVEASDGKVGNAYDRFILTCFQFDGHSGRYAMVAINMMKAGGAMMICLGGAAMLFLFRRGRSDQAA